MKWFAGVILALILLASLDFSNALWVTRHVRQNLASFTLLKTGTVKAVYPVQKRCPSRITRCSQRATDITFDLGNSQFEQTTIFFVDYTSDQVGESVPLLCDTGQRMCLPRTFVHERRSIWESTYFFRVLNRLRQ